MDSSAAQSFARLQELLANQRAELVVAHAWAGVRAQCLAASLDRGLAWCEARLLAELVGAGTPEEPDNLHAALAQALGSVALADAALACVEHIELAPGQVLIANGDVAQDLYLQATDALTAQRTRDGEATVRLQTQNGGASMPGELAFCLGLPRSAEVVAEQASVVWRLPAAELARIEHEPPQLAIGLHRLVAAQLAARVVHLTALVEALDR